MKGYFYHRPKEIVMLTFKIDAKRDSPEVLIDRENHIIDITGTSTFENTSWFYSTVLKWVIAFNTPEPKKITINIRLTKINDGTIKWLMLILQRLANVVPKHSIVINWYYKPKNTSILLNGERIKLNVPIPVNIIAA